MPPTTEQVISLPKIVTVRKLAELANLPVTLVISTLFRLGVKATINESIDFDTAAILADELNFSVRPLETDGKETDQADKANFKPRPPVVTVLGHVDHGKTSLLDAIREANVAAGEAGGITQHINAYQVSHQGRSITLLDTPGHEAFVNMRAHGVNLTDIALLVVAANEGLKPQTYEAISHVKAAGVPMVVVINKIDLPDADPEKVKRQLAETGLLVEDWGGKIPVVNVSATQKKGLKELLDLVLLVADLQEITANPAGELQGVVIESRIEPGLGPVAIVIIKNGTLRKGEVVVAGRTWGKVRSLYSWTNEKILAGPPSTPVKIAGFKLPPYVGEILARTGDEKTGREKARQHSQRLAIRSIKEVKPAPTEDQNEVISRTLPIVIKADVLGSQEAVETALTSFKVPDITLKIIHRGLGTVTESDLNAAAGSQALIIAFRVPVPTHLKKRAVQNKIRIITHDIIYRLLEEVKTILTELLVPETVDKEIGRLTVLKVFFQTAQEAIIGGRIDKGEVKNQLKVKVLRSEQPIGDGQVIGLKIGVQPIDHLTQGQEGGFKIRKNLKTPFRIKPHDQLVLLETEKIIKKIYE